MRCDVALAGTALPTLSVPVLFSPDPWRLASFYVHALGFELVQHIPGVFAALRHDGLPLQVWGRNGALPGRTQVVLEQDDPSIFDVHRHLMRVAPVLMDRPAPSRQPWGAWQCCLTDIDGNRIVFMQWNRQVQGARDLGPASLPEPKRSP